MQFSYKDLPNNTEAERAVLGACLLSEKSLGDVIEIIKPDDFYDINNKMAYDILIEMYNADKKIDLVTFSEAATAKGIFDRLGGQPFLAELMSDVTVTLNSIYHAEIVKKYAIRRNFITAGEQITSLAMKSDIETSELISGAEKIILDSSLEKIKSAPLKLMEISSSALDRVKKITNGELKKTGYKTGFVDLDNLVSFQPRSLNIIAARPSMGKTALALNIAQFGGNVSDNAPVLIFSLEMSKEQLLYRMWSSEAKVNLTKIMNGELLQGELERVETASKKLDERNIFINDISELSIADFRAKCRRFKAQHPNLALVIVDYLQLMNTGKKAQDNRAFEVAEISRVMKSTAVELNCPIISLSQLSRETEKRNDKLPRLSDLRDSGAIEQDADTVILLFREDYYEQEPKKELYEKLWSKADLRIAKNRNGKTGTCSLLFMREYTKFENYEEV